MVAHDKVLPAAKYAAPLPPKYAALLHVEGKQPQRLEKVFDRLLAQTALPSVVDAWSHRFVEADTEHAYQLWSVAYYATSARLLLGCVLFFHMMLVLIDGVLFSQSSYLVKYGRTEYFQWCYLPLVLPFVVAFPAAVHHPRWLMYVRNWKWIVAVAMALLAPALMVRAGCIYEAKMSYVSSTTTLRAALNSNDDLMITSSAIVIFLAQTVVAATHCDFIQIIFVWAGCGIGVIANVFYWDINAHGETYMLMGAGGLICVVLARELDLSHRKSFYHYFTAEKSNEVLRESLDQMIELVVFDEYKAEEKAVVENLLDAPSDLQAKLQPYRIPLEHLTLQRVIGRGGFGEVILADYYGTQVVLKRMHRAKISDAAIREFAQEIVLMCELRHPNVVQFIGASWNTYSNIGFVLEYVGHGDLYLTIHDKRVAKAWSDPFHRIAVDAARGICYLHSKSIVHRDLKSTNVLISATYSAKICDLGMSKSLAELKATEKQVGTPLWTAPEVVLRGCFSTKSDVFAYGIILCELLTRKTPYQELKMSPFNIMLAVANEGLRPTLPQWLPVPLRHLIDVACLSNDPKDRPEMLDVLKALQTNAMHELRASEQWTKVKQLVHEHAHRATSLSLEMSRAARDQAALEAYTQPTALLSSDSDAGGERLPAGVLASAIETTVESWD
ncbi:protein kinase [Achlya hypogyna]|uniref:Protein kinase n=1 Tax=Achlya hypogyna TaxID=1202772 RepID=A0A1V9Z0V5_ACHHY|nr:protein kinase [Achlya hypogyna]